MSSPNISAASLPRKLSRPLFTFFLIATFVFVLAIVVAAFISMTSKSFNTLELVALMGGALWVGLAISVLASWQTLTLFDNHLVFSSFGRKTTIFYKDVDEVDVELFNPTGGYAIPMLTLDLYHQGEGKNPITVNLKLFRARDHVFLLQLIKTNAPDARLSPLAEQMSQGK